MVKATMSRAKAKARAQTADVARLAVRLKVSITYSLSLGLFSVIKFSVSSVINSNLYSLTCLVATIINRNLHLNSIDKQIDSSAPNSRAAHLSGKEFYSLSRTLHPIDEICESQTSSVVAEQDDSSLSNDLE